MFAKKQREKNVDIYAHHTVIVTWQRDTLLRTAVTAWKRREKARSTASLVVVPLSLPRTDKCDPTYRSELRSRKNRMRSGAHSVAIACRAEEKKGKLDLQSKHALCFYVLVIFFSSVIICSTILTSPVDLSLLCLNVLGDQFRPYNQSFFCLTEFGVFNTKDKFI